MWFILFGLPAVFANCPNDFIYEQSFNRCYQYVGEATQFYLAEQKCKTAGANLASISDGFENAMIAEAAKHQFDSKQFWIGANQLSNSNWTWIDGAAFEFSNWAQGQPLLSSGQCVYVEPAKGDWTVTQCWTIAPFVCVVASVGPTEQPVHPYCDSTWTYYSETDSCYSVGYWKAFEDAESDCVHNGAHLTSIHSTAENGFVNGLAAARLQAFNADSQTWIGLKRAGSSWAWTDGSKFDYWIWAARQPDNAGGVENCGQTYSDYMDAPEPFYQRWNDYVCERPMRAYVCKKGAIHK